MANPKNRYHGRFNYCHEVHILYCYASSERQAKLIFINRLSKLLDRSPWSLNGLYNNYLDNYSVTLETEFTEIGETADEHLCEYCCMRKKECDGKGNIEFTEIKKPPTKEATS